MEIFKIYPWTGNLKQFVTVIEQAVDSSQQEAIYPQNLPAHLQEYQKDLSYQLAKNAADLLK